MHTKAISEDPGLAGGGSWAAGARHRGRSIEELTPDILVNILEWLCWGDVALHVAQTNQSWHLAAHTPTLWADKHLEHFGWASLRWRAVSGFEVAGARQAFHQLRSVQALSLRGEALDVIGQFVGKDAYQKGGVFNFRMQLFADSAGDMLWRGAAEQGPFFETCEVLQEGALERMAKLPAAARGRIHRRYGLASAAQACEVRGVKLDGTERPVGGFLQWSVDTEGTDPVKLEHMESLAARVSAMLPSGDGTPVPSSDGTPVRRRALEYVSGVFIPSLRCFMLAGTHMSRGGFGVIGLEQYDIRLAEDGLSVTGVTRGLPSPGEWLNEIQGEASCLVDATQVSRCDMRLKAQVS
jgi:hypothetical protein